VSLDYREDELLLAINDNGKGFAPEKQHEGSGLLNMQTRAAMIGGSMHVESNNKGTTIYLQLPIHE
jgi:signal transduction histidine kinase